MILGEVCRRVFSCRRSQSVLKSMSASRPFCLRSLSSSPPRKYEARPQLQTFLSSELLLTICNSALPPPSLSVLAPPSHTKEFRTGRASYLQPNPGLPLCCGKEQLNSTPLCQGRRRRRRSERLNKSPFLETITIRTEECFRAVCHLRRGADLFPPRAEMHHIYER